MRLPAGLLLAISIAVPLSAQTSPAPIAVTDLFRQAHDRLTNVAPPANKGYALASLLQKAGGLPIAEMPQWCSEAFDLSQQMPPGSNRIFVQEMAISVMGRRDPDAALAMLARMDPITASSLNYFNIGHGTAVASLFSSMFNKYGTSVAPSLLNTIDTVAAKGLYPYLAVEPLMAHSKIEEATKLFQQAVDAYVRSKPSVTNDFEFVFFLKQTGLRVPTVTASAAARAIAARLLQFTPSGATCRSTLRLYTDKGMVVLDCGERLIYEALPILQKMNPSVVAGLKKAAVFQQLEGAKVKSMMPMANPSTPSEKATERQAEFDVSMMLHDMAKEDTDKAAQLAATLNDEKDRLNTMARIATEAATKEPQKARALMYQVLNEAAKIDDVSWKLTVTSNIAHAAVRLGDAALAESAIRTVFALAHDFGKAMRDRSSEQRVIYASNGYRAMIATRLGASFAPQLTLSLIPTIDDDECEAYLLMAFAEAIMRPMPL